VLRERVAELRPAHKVPEAFGRTEYRRASCASGTCGSPPTTSRSATARPPCCRCSSGCRATRAGFSGA
jgi:hypothetical protein